MLNGTRKFYKANSDTFNVSDVVFAVFDLYSFCLQEKDKGTRLAYVTPTPTVPRRLASTSDIDEKENR